MKVGQWRTGNWIWPFRRMRHLGLIHLCAMWVFQVGRRWRVEWSHSADLGHPREWRSTWPEAVRLPVVRTETTRRLDLQSSTWAVLSGRITATKLAVPLCGPQSILLVTFRPSIAPIRIHSHVHWLNNTSVSNQIQNCVKYFYWHVNDFPGKCYVWARWGETKVQLDVLQLDLLPRKVTKLSGLRYPSVQLLRCYFASAGTIKLRSGICGSWNIYSFESLSRYLSFFSTKLARLRQTNSKYFAKVANVD